MSNESSPAMFAATDRAAAQWGDLIILFARLVMGWLFFTNGWMKLMNPGGFVTYLTNLKVPSPELLAWPALFAELGIGIALILGIATRYASIVTFIYLIITILVAHRYWEYPAAQQNAQYAHFCKNLALLGGAMMLFWSGAGRYSADAKLRGR